MIELQDIGADDWELWRDLRLAALEEAPYAFGSRLDAWADASEERWRDRLGLPNAYQVIAHLGGTPAGMGGGFQTEDPHVAELVAMWVAPPGRGRAGRRRRCHRGRREMGPGQRHADPETLGCYRQ